MRCFLHRFPPSPSKKMKAKGFEEFRWQSNCAERAQAAAAFSSGGIPGGYGRHGPVTTTVVPMESNIPQIFSTCEERPMGILSPQPRTRLAHSVDSLMGCVSHALEGEPSTRPAGAFWKHHPILDQAVNTFTQASLAFQRDVGCGIVKLTPSGAYQATRFGLLDEWQGDALGRRAIVGRPVIEPADWSGLAGRAFGRQEEISLATARALREALGPDQPLIATVFRPASIAMQLIGNERLAAQLQSSPDELAFGMQVLADSVAALIGGFIEAGVDGIYYVDQHSAQPALAHFTRWCLDSGFDAGPFQAAKSLPIRILHYHGESVGHDVRCAPMEWNVHFERTGRAARRPAAAARLALTLPLTQIVRDSGGGAKREAIRRALLAAGLSNALVTAPCVVPHKVPNATLRAWMEVIRGWR